MIGYKIMRKRNHIPGQVIHTSEFNYSNRISASREDYQLQSMLLRVAHDTGVPFAALTVFAMQAQCGEINPHLVELLKREDPELVVDLSVYTPVATYGQVISGARLSHICNAALRAELPIGEGTQDVLFWEMLYELIRVQTRPSCPSRYLSYYAFKDIETLKTYRDRHWADKMDDKIVCKIDASDCDVAFEADTTLLDRIDANYRFEAAMVEVHRYFDQERSDDPVVEVLLQGRVKILEEVTL